MAKQMTPNRENGYIVLRFIDEYSRNPKVHKCSEPEEDEISLSSVRGLWKLNCLAERDTKIGQDFLRAGGLTKTNWGGMMRRALVMRIAELLYSNESQRKDILNRIKCISLDGFSQNDCFCFERSGIFWARGIQANDHKTDVRFCVKINEGSFSCDVLENMMCTFISAVHKRSAPESTCGIYSTPTLER